MPESAVNHSKSQLPVRLIVVLGMHRSGTSYLAGSLQKAGLMLGDCHTWNKHNEKGNRENQKFVDLHDAILDANAGAWDAPPNKVIWSDNHIATGRALLEEHAGEPNFGFKDPRTLLVLEGWKSIYPSIELVGIYRHPNAVAKSLQKRSSKSREGSLRLWYAYNKILFQEYKRNKFSILNFDDSEELLDRKMLKAADDLGLLQRNEEERFYTADLRHNDGAGAPSLPWKVNRLYKKLKKSGVE